MAEVNPMLGLRGCRLGNYFISETITLPNLINIVVFLYIDGKITNNSFNYQLKSNLSEQNFILILGILIPELVEMQARALFEASVSLMEKGIYIYVFIPTYMYIYSLMVNLVKI
jgi:hypothetical protein